MNSLEPSTSGWSVPAPPAKASPSILPTIVDGDAVAFSALPSFGLVAARGFGDALHLLVDLGVRHVEDLAGHLDAGEILDLDRRNDLIGELELEIGAAGEDLLGFLLVLGHVDLGLHGGLLAALGDDRSGSNSSGSR